MYADDEPLDEMALKHGDAKVNQEGMLEIGYVAGRVQIIDSSPRKPKAGINNRHCKGAE